MTLGKLESKTENQPEPKLEQVQTKTEPKRQSKPQPMNVAQWAQHLFDAELPLRAGAIRELTRHLKRKTLDAQFVAKLRESAMASLSSDDSFLFLSGVEALATLALEDDELLKHLLQQFRQSARNSHTPVRALKFGEILARVCRQLGDLAPRHAVEIVPVLLNCAAAHAKNADATVTASAISAAGSLLPLTGFFLHDIQHEVCSLITGFLALSMDNIVRLAACSLARQIFIEIGGRISQLTDEIMRDLYRQLKRIAYDDLEDQEVREKVKRENNCLTFGAHASKTTIVPKSWFT